MHKPTEAELEILQVLWKRGACTVREVHEQLSQQKDTGYTTTLKLMQMMHEKGILKRNESQRSHVYEALWQEEEVQKSLLARFVETAFGGSAMKLVMQALGNSKTTEKELKQIKEMINQIEQEQQKQKGGE
ncbi:MAG: BlaI/MecI/CopY family transcriptional regulator [Microscillaceae bacterium]|nr:BlaI/MecI/CopY family transcriptional regulator [Microscillaceae bacterium]MDW8459790.1 BlaI/MecI/CopY family transcriptional regulator [Cytophagales bacterium]